jgi:hypothetical protein
MIDSRCNVCGSLPTQRHDLLKHGIEGPYLENPPCFSQHGSFVHGRDCEPVSETNRWWQAYCAILQSGTLPPNPWGKFCIGADGPFSPQHWARLLADKAIEEAREAGRLGVSE